MGITINQLFAKARNEGVLSSEGYQALTVIDPGQDIQNALALQRIFYIKQF
jgi:hypothetical protein